MMDQPLLIHVTTVPGSLYRLFAGQFEYMQSQGFDVAAVSSGGERVEQVERERGLKVYVVPMARAIAPLSDVVAIVRLYRVFRAAKPALVHSHTPKAGLVGSLAAMLAGVPVRFYSVRGLRFLTMTGWRKTALMLAERLACSCSNRVLCNSDSNHRIVLREGLCAPEKITVLGHGSGNGVDVERFHQTTAVRDAALAWRRQLSIPADAPVVGFVGRLARDKGMGELTEAWKAIRSEIPQAHLLIVGRPDAADPVPASVLRELADDGSVHMVGSQPDVVPFYAAMDVFTLPSYREGFPNVVLESAAMELPTVAFNVSGCSDAVVPGETGELVDVHDAEQLASTVIELLRDDKQRLRMGRHARQHVEAHYTPQRIWSELVEEYRQFLPGNTHERTRGPKKTLDPDVARALHSDV